MTDLSPREKAPRAYDPPKPKIPVLPPWEEFSYGRNPTYAGFSVSIPLAGFGVSISKSQYDAIRTLTSKEQE